MKSGLEGRNNYSGIRYTRVKCDVSMKSGLEGRNNVSDSYTAFMAENKSQ